MNKNLIRKSKFLSLVLRHKPEAIGLPLDKQGWANVEELLAKVNAFGQEFSITLLSEIVDTSDKKRFIFSDDKRKIRANQGHSISVDLGLEALEPPDILLHGTAKRFAESIRHNGLLPGNRQHVHLSIDKETALQVGGRHGVPVIFSVNALSMHQDGIEFYRSENGVWLVGEVKSQYLTQSQ